MHVDGKSHGRRLSAMCTAKSAPAAPAVAALWAAHGRRNARTGMGLVKLVHRSHARGHACLKEQIARVARAAIGQGRRAENLDLFAVCRLVTVCALVQPHGRRLGGKKRRLGKCRNLEEKTQDTLEKNNKLPTTRAKPLPKHRPTATQAATRSRSLLSRSRNLLRAP